MNSTQETSALRAEVEALRAELDRADEFASGILVLLLDLLPPLLQAQPTIADRVLPSWKRAAERWERISQHPGQQDDEDETAEKLEPRKLLYRLLQTTGGLPHGHG